GVHVTAIFPGFIESEMTRDVPLRMPPASVVGDLVVRLLRHPRPRAVLPRHYGAAIWLNRFAPGLVDRVLVKLQRDLDRKRAG
ncbi:MAG TPA: short-chain dehydrogenase, partial [Armatimonadota bacterium]|nr:short-chain dehydrogenase [Armatimonadota bacterium]